MTNLQVAHTDYASNTNFCVYGMYSLNFALTLCIQMLLMPISVSAGGPVDSGTVHRRGLYKNRTVHAQYMDMHRTNPMH